MTLHPDEQARELVDRIFDAFDSQHGPSRTGIEESVAALLAKARLAEAEWWEHLAPDCDLPENQPCGYCERIAELERQAAGEETK